MDEIFIDAMRFLSSEVAAFAALWSATAPRQRKALLAERKAFIANLKNVCLQRYHEERDLH